jgi:hypothetical protein
MYAIRIVIFEFYKTKRTFTKLKSRKIKHGLRQSIERTQHTYYGNRLRFRTFLPHRYNPESKETSMKAHFVSNATRIIPGPKDVMGIFQDQICHNM